MRRVRVHHVELRARRSFAGRLRRSQIMNRIVSRPEKERVDRQTLERDEIICLVSRELLLHQRRNFLRVRVVVDPQPRADEFVSEEAPVIWVDEPLHPCQDGFESRGPSRALLAKLDEPYIFRGETIPSDRRAQFVADAATAGELSSEASVLLFRGSGGRAIYNDNMLDRKSVV